MGVLKNLPALERPREKASRYGIDTLSDVELLSIILASGYQGSNVLEISSYLINKYGGLQKLSEQSLKELKKNKGIKDAKSLLLSAVFEIHYRLLLKNKKEENETITNDYLVEKYYPILSRCNQEILIVVLLNARHRIIFEKILYRGSKNMISVNFDDIRSLLERYEAKSYYVIHNHVEGDSTPSDEDIIVTNNIILQSKKMNIKLEDHLIISRNDYYSFSKVKKTNISC